MSRMAPTRIRNAGRSLAPSGPMTTKSEPLSILRTARGGAQALCRHKAVRRQASSGRGPGDLSQIGLAELLDVIIDVVKVVEMQLFFIDDRFNKLHAGAVAVFPANQQELVIGVDGVVLQFRVKGKYLLNDLTPLYLPCRFAGRLPAQFFLSISLSSSSVVVVCSRTILRDSIPTRLQALPFILT